MRRGAREELRLEPPAARSALRLIHPSQTEDANEIFATSTLGSEWTEKWERSNDLRSSQGPDLLGSSGVCPGIDEGVTKLSSFTFFLSICLHSLPCPTHFAAARVQQILINAAVALMCANVLGTATLLTYAG